MRSTRGGFSGAGCAGAILTLLLIAASGQASQGRASAPGTLKVGIALDPPGRSEALGKARVLQPHIAREAVLYLGDQSTDSPDGLDGLVAGLQTGKYDIIGADLNATPRDAR